MCARALSTFSLLFHRIEHTTVHAHHDAGMAQVKRRNIIFMGYVIK